MIAIPMICLSSFLCENHLNAEQAEDMKRNKSSYRQVEGRLAEEDLGEAGLDGVGEAEVAEGEVHQLKTLLIELEFLGRYSGGGRRGGSLPKAAVAAWGGYQV